MAMSKRTATFQSWAPSGATIVSQRFFTVNQDNNDYPWPHWRIGIYMNGKTVVSADFRYEHMADLFWNKCIAYLSAGVVTGVEPDWVGLINDDN